jgi:hypothetical protein
MTAASETIAAARAAAADIRRARNAVAGDRRKLREIRLSADAAELELAELREAETADAARRHLDGEEAVPVNPARAARIAKLSESIPAERAAAELLSRRIAAAESAIDSAPYTAALLAVAGETLGNAEAEIREILEKLAEPLARILAAGELVESQLGSRFAVPPGATVPTIGAPAAKKLLAAIPDRFRPVDLVEKVIRSNGASIAQSLISEINQ